MNNEKHQKDHIKSKKARSICGFQSATTLYPIQTLFVYITIYLIIGFHLREFMIWCLKN